MLPNEENMIRTSFSVHFFDNIPMNSFLSFRFSLSAGFICIGWCISKASQGSGKGRCVEVRMARPLPLSKDLAKRLWKSCLLSAARFTAAFAFSLLLSRLFRCLTSIEERVIGATEPGAEGRPSFCSGLAPGAQKLERNSSFSTFYSNALEKAEFSLSFLSKKFFSLVEKNDRSCSARQRINCLSPLFLPLSLFL